MQQTVQTAKDGVEEGLLWVGLGRLDRARRWANGGENRWATRDKARFGEIFGAGRVEVGTSWPVV